MRLALSSARHFELGLACRRRRCNTTKSACFCFTARVLLSLSLLLSLVERDVLKQKVHQQVIRS